MNSCRRLTCSSINRDVKIYFLDLEFMLLLLNFIVFIISIETEASLLALAKSIYYTGERGGWNYEYMNFISLICGVKK